MAQALITRRGGAGASYKITSASSAGALPASAPEDTLAVITGVAIGKKYISAAAPVAPAIGDVWITIVGLSYRKIAIAKGCYVYPALARQWDGSAWVQKPLYVFYASEWRLSELYLYSLGSTPLGLALTKIESGSTITLNANNFVLNSGNGASSHAFMQTPPINLSPVSRIYASGYGTNAYMSPEIAVSSVAGYSTSNAAYVYNGVAGDYTVSLDVAALNGEYFIKIGKPVNPTQGAQSLTIFKIWME